MIEAVILDMDGLLIDSEPYWQETERKIFAELGIDISTFNQQETFGLRANEQIRFWYHKKPWDNPDFACIEKKYNDTLKSYFIEEAELMPGAMYIIDFIRKKKLPLAIASSSDMDLIETFVEHFKVRDKIDFLYSAEYEEYGKPHPGVYLSTARKMNIPPHSCLAFEDSLHGLVAAKAARMKVVAVPDNSHAGFPGYGLADLKLASLTDFNEQLFQHLNR